MLTKGTCKICKDGIEYKRLKIHVLKKHKIDMDEYEMYGVKEEVEIMEFEPKAPISHSDLMDNIFSGKTKESYLKRPLKDFLDRYNVTEKELTSIVLNYTEGKPLPLEQAQKLGEKKGMEEARSKKHLNSVRTPNLHTAEALVKQYGFKCTAVHSAKGSIPKMWELEKQTET